jgi:integrase
LGPYGDRDVSLKLARILAAQARALAREGIDPIERRHREANEKRLAQGGLITFKEAAQRYVAAHSPSWRNAKHRAQWSATLEKYAFPIFGSEAVGDVETNLVLKSLEPIWQEKPETAKRLRGRIERIFDWATVRGLRKKENPARWRGHLDHLLPAPGKIKRVVHHPALRYTEMSAFFSQLVAKNGVAARALEIAILTALRTNEVINATWDEIDLAAATWTIPANRMKASREHRVPLCDLVLRKFSEIKPEAGNPYVFIGGRAGKPLSNMAMLNEAFRVLRDGRAHEFADQAAEVRRHQHGLKPLHLFRCELLIDEAKEVDEVIHRAFDVRCR